MRSPAKTVARVGEQAADDARRGGDAMPSDRDEQRRRLRMFLIADIPANVFGVVLIGVVLAVYPVPHLEWLLAAVSANLVGLIYALRLANRNQVEAAVFIVCGFMWVITAMVAFVIPPVIGVVAILLVWPVALALPYLSQRGLLRMITFGVVMAAIVGGLPWRGDPEGVSELLPSWIPLAVQHVLFPTFSGLIFLLLYQYSGRLTSTLAEVQRTNAALRASERDLEEKVANRTAQLVESRDRALAATRAKSTFLANMSHELRTPLNAIIGYAEMLAEELGDDDHPEPQRIEDVEKIEAAGRHLLTLIDGVLDLSKVEAGRMELFVEEFELAPLVEEARQLVQPLVARNDNRLVVTLGPDAGRVHADQTKLRQVIVNLLSNAAKFTEAGEIGLSVRREKNGAGDEVVFEIRDTGIGISAAQQQRLFQPFQQADSSTTKRFGGTGLGLAISLRFCEMMGGGLSLDSEPGAGSVFTVRIPAEPRADPAVSPQTVSKAQT